MRKLFLGLIFCGVILILSADTYASTSCPEKPAPNEVLLFTEENFQGECTSYIGFNREIRFHKGKTRSVKVGSGIVVTLYKIFRLKGRSQFGSDPEYPVWNKKSSNWRSLRLSKKSAPIVSVPKPCSGNEPKPGVEAAAEQVTIFTEPNFGGACKTIDYTGRDQKPYPYSIAWDYKTKTDFWNSGTLRKQKATFNSMMVGSGVVVTVCTGTNLRGTCKDFTNTVIDLTGEGVGYNSINSFKIYTLNPKDYKNPMLPNDNEVTVCEKLVFGGGCRKLRVGNFDFRGLTYRYIHVGSNVKAQTYFDRDFYGSSETYPGGSKQATTGSVKSIRVMNSTDNLVAVKPRSTPAPPTVIVEKPKVDLTPPAEDVAEKRFILTGMGNKCLTIKGGNINNYTPVILSDCVGTDSQKWAFSSDGRIRGVANMCLTHSGALQIETCAPLGSQYWTVTDTNEIKRAWACLTSEKLKNGSPTTGKCKGNSFEKWRFAKNVKPKAKHGSPNGRYSYCAIQGGQCNFQGTGIVAYGVNGKFKYRRNVRGSIACSDQNFGDPAPGYKKRCYFIKRKPQTPVANHYPPKPFNGVKFSFCANEGGQCPAVGYSPRQVAFGVNGKFVYKNTTKAVRCGVSTFGSDPAPGVKKRCYTVRMTFRRIAPK